MAKTTESVRFTRNADGCVNVSVPPDLQPLDDFLETDLGDSDALELVVGRVRDAATTRWVFGGDCCHLTVRGGEVLIENDFSGREVTLSRAEFLVIVAEFARAVNGTSPPYPTG